MKILPWNEVLKVMVLVLRQDFTCKISSLIRKGSEVEREARQVNQTGERACQTILADTFNKSSDVQVGEFIL